MPLRGRQKRDKKDLTKWTCECKGANETLIFTSSTGDTKRMGSYDQKYLHKI